MNLTSTSPTTSTASTSYNRITGLATGLDTDSIVKSMMQGQQTKIDKADQQKQLLQFQQEAYRDVITDLRDFYSKYTDITKPDNSLLLSKNYQSSTFTSSDAGSVTAEGLAGAQVGTYKVQVNSLATKASVSFADFSGGIKTANTTLTINGKAVVVDMTTGAPTDDEIMARINTAISNAGVDAKMTKSDLSGKYILQTNQTGSAQSIVVSGATYTGTDANVTITDTYGNTAAKTYENNNFVVDNVKFTITATTASDVTLTGKTDITDLKKRIVEFVTDYNKLIDTITTKLQEKKNSGYPPLTDAQKASMTTDQITKWEAKAKEGLLRNDGYLSSIVNQLRTAINTSVGGSTIKYTDLGIDFTNDYTKPGQLTVDEAKLTTALQNNPDQVLKLFTNFSDDTNATTKYNNSGIMQRFKTILNDNVISSTSLLLKKVGYDGSVTFYNNTLKTSIDYQTKMIADLQSRFKEQQDRLYQKFATLESAMNSYNSQSTYLSSMLGQ